MTQRQVLLVQNGKRKCIVVPMLTTDGYTHAILAGEYSPVQMENQHHNYITLTSRVD
jgi:hypothetical protein